MNAMTAMIAGGCLAMVMFGLGLMAGLAAGSQRQDRRQSDRFAEAVNLWKSIHERIDEMTRRNLAQLESVRQRLLELGREKGTSDLIRSIDELVAYNRQLRDEMRKTNSNPESNAPKDREPVDADGNFESHATIEETALVAAQEIPKPCFDEALADLRRLIQLGRPLSVVLDAAYDRLQSFLDFQRMGYAVINYRSDRVFAVWHRCEITTHLEEGYSAALSQSSLRFVADLNRPRILNNLPDYLARHPQSNSTRLLVEDGFRSSLTCPVRYDGTVIGFLFLTSVQQDAFDVGDASLIQRLTPLLGRCVFSSRSRESLVSAHC